ncbi:hypothetical protein BC835DRAFT_828989 [Cytidiella melzeri]|nr:hypothetical protein BC835DRAFT_828989 [Cytidiella melzeri]
MSIDSQIVQDLIPGTGSLGSVPQHHDFKRVVVRPAPKVFTVEVLPPKKFGSGHCYGLLILPILESSAATSSASSIKTGSSNTEYEVWRRWEDCLWFQEMLESEYKLMSRTKRIRLQRGKGVKKDGMYMQSGGAASFDSLPPGPDVNDIAKNVHDILPKLTKKGTIFRASQATVEQRAREFAALIHAVFDDEVPTLIKELRDNRIIRDFFGYWRRDKDHDRKASEVEARSKRASRTSVTSSVFSMYFSASNISLQLPNAFADMPPSPALPDSVKAHAKAKAKGKAPERSVTKSASFSSSSSSSSRGDPQTPTSAPAALSFTVSDTGALLPTSPISDDESYFRPTSGPSSAPLRLPRGMRTRKSQGDRNFAKYGFDSASESEDNGVSVPDSPWSVSLNAGFRRPRNLEALPEEQELVPSMADTSLTRQDDLPPPARRQRNHSCPDPHNRNGLIFVTPPDSATPMPDACDEVSVIDSIRGDAGFSSDRLAPDTPVTYSTSSKHTSMALSSFSGEASRRSSWRTSLDSANSLPTQESAQDLSVDLDDVFCGSPPLSRSSLSYGNAEAMHRRRMSITTMNSVVSNASVDAVLPRRPLSPIYQGASVRRSMSAGSRHSRQSMPASLREEVYFEGEDIVEDELLDAYFYDPGLRVSGVPSMTSDEQPGQDTSSVLLARFPQPPQSAPATRLSGAPPTPSSPQYSVASPTSATSSSPSTFTESITIKAVRQDSIVLVRASYSTPLSDLRLKIREKFAQEGVSLTDTFTIGFNPAVTAAEDRSRAVPPKGRPRSQSTSAVGQLGAQPRLRFLIYEEDWQQATIGCPGKLTLHIFDRF